MVGLRDRFFLVSGTEFSQRKRAIDNIKKRILKNKSAPLNILTLYSKEIDLKDLSQKLFTVSFDKTKIVVFKNFESLASKVKEFIFQNYKKILIGNYLIFETEKDLYQLKKNKRIASDKFFNLIFKEAASFKVFSTRPKATTNDLMYSLRGNDLNSSLYILESLFKDGAKEEMLGPLIIGMLVRKCSYMSDPVKKDKCFNYLWEADRRIKEKGLGSRLIVEVLLVKLFSLN